MEIFLKVLQKLFSMCVLGKIFLWIKEVYKERSLREQEASVMSNSIREGDPLGAKIKILCVAV